MFCCLNQFGLKRHVSDRRKRLDLQSVRIRRRSGLPEMPVDGICSATSCTVLQGISFEVDVRYKMQKITDRSACCIVCSAEDVDSGEQVAVTRIQSVFQDTDCARRILRELRILRHLQHDNLLQVKDVFFAGGRHEFRDLYTVMDLMDTDLHRVLRSQQQLTDDHRRYFLYQVLRGMKYVHSALVVHGDLKPASLLVNRNCDLKISGFGSVGVCFVDEARPLTEFVCARWYVAPQRMRSSPEWSWASDVWSIGCILAEMYTRKPLFPGRDSLDHIRLVVSLLGSQECEELLRALDMSDHGKMAFLAKPVGPPFIDAFPGMDPLAQDLLSKMLRGNPVRRITVGVSLKHPFLDDLHCPDDELERGPLDSVDFEFERRRLAATAFREEVFRETLLYHPALRDEFQQDVASQVEVYDIRQYELLGRGESLNPGLADDGRISMGRM